MRKEVRFGLFAKFLVVLGALALIPVSFFAYRSMSVSEVSIENSVLELHTKLAEKMALSVSNYFKFTDDKLAFAVSALQQNLTWENKQALIGSLLSTNPDITQISFINDKGIEFLSFPQAASKKSVVSRAEEEGFKNYLALRRRASRLIHEPASLEIYYPISKTVAARVLVSLEALSQDIVSERVGGTGFAVMVDDKGKPLFYPKEKLDSSLGAEMPNWSLVQASFQSDSVVSERVPDRDLIGASRSIAQNRGAIVILQSYQEAYAGILAMRRSSVIALAGVLLVSVAGATFLARRLTAPLLELTRGAEAISKGDFKTEVRVATRDEIADLADTFNRMSSRLDAYSEMQVDRLVEEQKKTEAILFSINEGILMTDHASHIQLANRRAREWMGINASEIIEGKTLPELIPQSKLRETILRPHDPAKPEAFTEIDLSTENLRRFARISTAPVISPKTQETLGVLTAVRDVTFEKELEKMKEEFLHSITHDLRNPLGSAMGFIEILMKGSAGGPLPDIQKNMVASVQRSLRRQMTLINNILDIAKMESGNFPLSLHPSSLGEIAGKSLDILQSLHEQKKISVAVKAEGVGPVAVDPDLIERVFTNLLGNAIKYTPAGGAITITVTDEGKTLLCAVEDTGPGIPAEFLERVFKKFEQVTGQKKGGTGLGLTIAKYFVERHRGRIWAESAPVQGARFCFQIPKNLVAGEKDEISVGPEAA